MNRRSFIKNSVLLPAGAALGSMPSAAVAGQISAKNTYDTDVLVVGAGASGIPAAIAAARTGARVILAEEDFVPGGAPVDMYVSMIFSGPQVGIFREMCEKLNAKFDLAGKVRKPRDDREDYYFGGANYWYLPSAFINVHYEMMAQEEKLEFKPGMRAINVLTEDGNRTKVKGVVFQGPGQIVHVVNAKVVIDATGTGLLADLAGCEYMYGRDAKSKFDEPWGVEVSDTQVQRITWMYISQRIKPDALMDVKKLQGSGLIEHGINKWVHRGAPEYYKRNTGIYLHWGSTVQCEDTRDPAAIGRAQAEAWPVIKDDMEYMASVGFGVHLAPKIGIREVRRVLGEHVLTVNDMREGAIPDDTIAYADANLDAWGTSVPRDEHQKGVPRYGIPYRCLLPKDTDGLLIAGKAISATHLATSAIRMQSIVASFGTGAGIAAALTALNDTNTRNISIKDVRKKLFDIGTLF